LIGVTATGLIGCEAMSPYPARVAKEKIEIIVQLPKAVRNIA
jgi:hypothetical protein